MVAGLLGVLVLVDARRVRKQRGGCSEEAQVLLGVAGELRAGQGCAGFGRPPGGGSHGRAGVAEIFDSVAALALEED